MIVKESIRRFWQKVRRHLSSGGTELGDASHEELLEALGDINPELFVELSKQELIVTAEGNRELFPLVDEIVNACPELPGWTIYALKPKIGLPARIQWNDLTVDMADVYFEPLQSEQTTELGIRLCVSGLPEERSEDAHNAVLRALDHYLGEREFAESIAFTELMPSGSAGCTGLIPLSDLEAFLSWRKRKVM